MEPVENKILIDAYFERLDLFSKLKRRTRKIFSKDLFSDFTIQGKPFRYGVKVKNIGDVVFEGAYASHLSIKPMSDMAFAHNSSKEFLVGTLNPGEETRIIIDEIKIDLSGQSWISFDLTPKQENSTLITFQKMLGTSTYRIPTQNRWGNSFVITSKFEAAQEQTNFLIIILTVLSVVDGIWGLGDAVDYILNSIKFLLEGVLSIINFFL